MSQNIIVFSGSRADFGILKNIYIHLRKLKKSKVKLLLGSQHFNSKFNNTYIEAKKNKLKADYKLNYKFKNTTREEIINQLSKNMLQIKKILTKDKPKICIVLGDRFEVHTFGLCCYILGIPLAHIHGGEITHGSFDDGFRHSLSKFSNLHFVSHEDFKKRLINLGENPKYIYNFGAPGAENARVIIKKKNFNFPLNKNFQNDLIIITYHSQTNKKFNEDLNILKNIFKLIKANKKYKYIFTNSNSDPGGVKLMCEINKFCRKNSNCINAKSLGHDNYLRLLSKSKLMIGNSSSGIIEGSTVRIPFLNIGHRQKGRLKSNNVFSVKGDLNSMIKGFKQALRCNRKKIKDIFFRKNTSFNISNTILKNINKNKLNFPKVFYEK